MKPAALLVLVLAASAFAACGPATVKKPDVAAKESSSGLPPHAVEVAYGMWECERGYVMRKKLCVPEEEVAKEPWFEVFGAPEAPVDLEAPPRRHDWRTFTPTFVWHESEFRARGDAAFA